MYLSYDLLFLCSHNVVFKPVPGAPPSLLLLNELDEAVENVDIAEFSREDCNKYLIKRGFFKKESPQDDVPDEFKDGPYHPREDL